MTIILSHLFFMNISLPRIFCVSSTRLCESTMERKNNIFSNNKLSLHNITHRNVTETVRESIELREGSNYYYKGSLIGGSRKCSDGIEGNREQAARSVHRVHTTSLVGLALLSIITRDIPEKPVCGLFIRPLLSLAN